MRSLVLDPLNVRFPERCAGCGADSERELTLEIFRGLDLLNYRSSYTCEVPLPACDRCWLTWQLRRILWIVGLIVVAILGFYLCVALIAAYEAVGVVIGGSLILMGFVALLLFRHLERELFQRMTSPVWLRNWKPDERIVELCFRDPKLAEEVERLSESPGRKAVADV